MVHPAQKAKANSKLAKKSKMPATNNAATGKFSPIKTAIIKDITNPMRAANTLGALSIGFAGIFSNSTVQ